MKLLIPLFTLISLSLTTPLTTFLLGAGDEPPASATTTLSLPATTLEVEVAWRQIGTDLSKWTEPMGLDEAGLHRLRVQTLLALGGQIRCKADLRFGEHRIRGGRHPFGFTVDPGGTLRFFVVEGTDALDVPSEPVEVSWAAAHLTLQLLHIGKDEVHLLWHLGEKAGRIRLRLGLGPR